MDYSKIFFEANRADDSCTFIPDYIVKCGNYRWYVHSHILKRQSDYFHEACEGKSSKDFQDKIIDLSNEKPVAVARVLVWIYTGIYTPVLSTPLETKADGFEYCSLRDFMAACRIDKSITFDPASSSTTKRNNCTTPALDSPVHNDEATSTTAHAETYCLAHRLGVRDLSYECLTSFQLDIIDHDFSVFRRAFIQVHSMKQPAKDHLLRLLADCVPRFINKFGSEDFDRMQQLEPGFGWTVVRSLGKHVMNRL